MPPVQKKKREQDTNQRGANFYRRGKGLRPILVYVPKDIHDHLKRLAFDEDRSLQKTVKRILINYIRDNKKGKG